MGTALSVNSRLMDCMDIYTHSVNAVINQKVLATVDYHSTLELINQLIDEVKSLNSEQSDNRGVRRIIESLLHASLSLNTITEGLARKASGAGKYGFFQYRKDLKEFDKLHHLYLLSLKLIEN